MDRKKLETICVFLGALLIVGAFILSVDDTSIIGILCVIVGIGSSAVRLVLGVSDTFDSAQRHVERKKAESMGDSGYRINTESEKLYYDKLKKYIAIVAQDGLDTMEKQKRILPDLLALVDELSVLDGHPAFEQVQNVQIDDAHGIGMLIQTTEKVLSSVDILKYVDKWQKMGNMTLLNAYTLLDFYNYVIKSDKSVIRVARYHLSKILINRLPQLEHEFDSMSRDSAPVEYHCCSNCNEHHSIHGMHFLDGVWLCDSCYTQKYGENQYD